MSWGIFKHLNTQILLISCTIVLCLFIGQPALIYSNEPNLSEVVTAVLIDYQTGRVLFSKKKDEIRPIASMTKIMTLYLALEDLKKNKFNLSDQIKASTKASKTGGSQIYLKEFEKMPAEEIIKSIAIKSANDAAIALAEFLAGNVDNFVNKMNLKAKSFGFKHTLFRSPHGLPGHSNKDDVSTAHEIALLSRKIIQDYPQVLKWTSTRMDYVRNEKFQLSNTNKLIGKFKGMDGLKTGYIRRSGFCLSGTALRKGMRLISVVMGGRTKSSRFDMTQNLLEYGFKYYQNRTVAKKGKSFIIPILECKTITASAHLTRDLTIVANKNELKKLEFHLFIPHGLKAPLPKGRKLAEYFVKLNGKILAKSDVIATEEILRASFFQRLFRRFNKKP